MLEPQSEAAKFAAENVRVTGDISNDTIHIKSIARIPQQTPRGFLVLAHLSSTAFIVDYTTVLICIRPLKPQDQRSFHGAAKGKWNRNQHGRQGQLAGQCVRGANLEINQG